MKIFAFISLLVILFSLAYKEISYINARHLFAKQLDDMHNMTDDRLVERIYVRIFTYLILVILVGILYTF